ncbi:MAG: pullulanase, partial [Bacteroidetes bacterium]|nr:pullulanase [Bacteroidota bacterium]
TWFVFGEKWYQVDKPTQVVVTGSFRSWSQDMADQAWHLKPIENSLWILPVYNPNFEAIPPRAEFKFRMNEGDWMQPPSGTPNEKGGNMVFMINMSIPTLKAEIRRPNTIWAKITGAYRPYDKSAYRLTNTKGQILEIAEVLPIDATQTLIIPAEPIDIRRVYYLEIPDQRLRAWCNYEGWFREIYSTKELGANISDDGTQTVFRLFAPRAEMVRLYLYDQAEGGEPRQVIEMKADADGVWESFQSVNLKGTYYDFTIHGASDPGNHFYETNPVHVSDPYARVNNEAWGRSRVWEKTKPATPLEEGIPPMESVIAYEVHVQDFTDRLPVAENLKGTIPAMTIPGLKNKKDQPIGFDYLTNLGINVVHLMPVQEFLHYKDNDWKASFENDPFMIEQGINLENYQWGYRTSHCFAIESKFRKKGDEPGAERDQFRDLVQA